MLKSEEMVKDSLSLLKKGKDKEEVEGSKVTDRGEVEVLSRLSNSPRVLLRRGETALKEEADENEEEGTSSSLRRRE